MSDSEDPIDAIDEGDDLFGDEDDADLKSPKERVLDDDDLASDPEGDAEPRRYDDADDTERVETVRRIMDATAYRHPIPKPTDGVLRVLRVPKFVKFHPEEYRPKSFEPSPFDTANARSAQPLHVARFSRDESSGFLDSNTNILRWSDGSITISIGGEQYEVTKKPLAPAPGKPYSEVNDGHYYAAAAELSSNMLMTVGHITEQYNIRPNKDVGDDALNLLADRMAKASQATNQDMIIRTTVDPELQKKKAEQLEKDRMKAQRRRENAQAKQDVGFSRPGRAGLSIGALEGGRRDGGRKRGPPGAAKPKRRRPEYDSDDDLPQGVGRQEKYEIGDFVVDSDAEEEEELATEDEEDEDEDDLLDDEPEPRRKRQRTAEPQDDEDASGDDVEPTPEASGRHRRRNVVDDDDED